MGEPHARAPNARAEPYVYTPPTVALAESAADPQGSGAIHLVPRVPRAPPPDPSGALYDPFTVIRIETADPTYARVTYNAVNGRVKSIERFVREMAEMAEMAEMVWIPSSGPSSERWTGEGVLVYQKYSSVQADGRICLHRTDGPAELKWFWKDGAVRMEAFRQGGLRIRSPDPVTGAARPVKRTWYPTGGIREVRFADADGLIHHDTEPARTILSDDGVLICFEFYRHGVLHCTTGPARVHKFDNGETELEDYALDGKVYDDQAQFWAAVPAPLVKPARTSA